MKWNTWCNLTRRIKLTHSLFLILLLWSCPYKLRKPSPHWSEFFQVDIFIFLLYIWRPHLGCCNSLSLHSLPFSIWINQFLFSQFPLIVKHQLTTQLSTERLRQRSNPVKIKISHLWNLLTQLLGLSFCNNIDICFITSSSFTHWCWLTGTLWTSYLSTSHDSFTT